MAERARDHTVKVVPQGLLPGRVYYFRFHARGEASPTGRTRTLPTGRLERLGIALMSCSNYSLGYFTTYDAVATDPTIDVVLHTGDYIYEYGNEFSRQSKAFVRPADPPHETVSLDDYRRRHATHKSDPSSQRMHAMHPFIALWDDHDVANDSWMGGAQNHQPETEGSWRDRREAALHAYYDWMPVRDPAPGRGRLDAWRTYRFGDLATLVTLETRLTARTQQVAYRDYKPRLETKPDRDAFVRDVLGDRRRAMMSDPMRVALAQGLAASVERRQPWRLIGNGVVMARVRTPDLRAARVTAQDYPEITLLDRYTDILWKAEHGLPDDLDAWDGYAGARQGFYELCQAAGVRDLLVLSGDSHSFWCNTLADDHGRPMGLELGTAGVSIQSEFEMAGFRPALIERLDGLYAAANPEVRWRDSAHRGYVRVTLGRESATAEFVAVQTDRPSGYATSVLRTEHIARRDGALQFAARAGSRATTTQAE
jgi:alkaline phosphatase D